MFTQARLKLTVFYSLLFLSLLWIFSFELYSWMERSFGEGYISEVKQQQAQQGQNVGEFDDSKSVVVTIAGDVALSRLRAVLVTINSISFFIIPIISWLLAKKSLTPIQIAHEKQKQFVSDASHELRTPLSIMTGEIDIALKKTRSVPEYQRVLQSNKEELQRLTSLVENLLFLAREDQHVKSHFTDSIDLTDILSTLLVQLKPVYTKKHLTVRFTPAKETSVVTGNATLIRQLFFNLLDNAFKYTKNGEVSIQCSREGKYEKVVIKDTGIGMSQEDQLRVFDRFYRVDNARSEVKGYGLGLAICNAIVKRHHGNIAITSKPLKGSIFTVSLPRNY